MGHCEFVLNHYFATDRVLKRGRDIVFDRRSEDGDSLESFADRSIDSINFKGFNTNAMFGEIKERCGLGILMDIVPLPTDQYEEATLVEEATPTAI